MKWVLAVQRIREDTVQKVFTEEVIRGEGLVSYNQHVQEVLRKYGEDKDIRILGNNRACIKAPDKVKHPVWYI